MTTDTDYQMQLARLAALREEAATCRLARRTGLNLWARLLPSLRCLEGWVERRAETSGQVTSGQVGATWKIRAR